MSNPCLNNGRCVDLPGMFRCDCPEGLSGPECDQEESCARDAQHTIRGSFYWPPTGSKMVAAIPCPRSPAAFATRPCVLIDNFYADWGESDVSMCSKKVHSSQEAMTALFPFTNTSLALRTPAEVAEAVRLLQLVVPFAFKDFDVAHRILDVTNEIFEVPEEIFAQSNTSESLRDVLTRFLDNAEWPKRNTCITMERTNLELQIKQVTWVEHDNGYRYSPKMTPGVQIFLPNDVFRRDISSERVKFVYYSSSRLFRKHNQKNDGFIELGDVITATITNKNELFQAFTQCISVHMPNRKVNQYNRCVYWEKETSSWKTDGIRTLSYRGPRIACCSQHLSSFAVISDPSVASTSYVDEDRFLAIASHTGQGVAIFCLSAVLFTYSVFRVLNRENFGQMVIQLTGSLVFMNVCVLVGHNRFQVGNEQLCMAVAVLTHYFVLSSLVWAAVGGHHVAQIIASEYATQDTIFLCKRCIFAWGVPFVPLSVALGADYTAYSGNYRSCFISKTSRYIYCGTYLTPVLLLLVANGAIFFLILRAIYRSTEAKRKTLTVKEPQIAGTLFALALIGMSWVAGFLSSVQSFIDYSLYFIYIFFGLNGFTGLGCFVFFLLLRKEARSSWQQFCVRKATSRRRVAGKPVVNTTTIKGEGDYTLVVDQAKARTSAHGRTSENTLRPDMNVRYPETRRSLDSSDASPISNRHYCPHGEPETAHQSSPSHYRAGHQSHNTHWGHHNSLRGHSPARGCPSSHSPAAEERRHPRDRHSPMKLNDDDGLVNTRV